MVSSSSASAAVVSVMMPACNAEKYIAQAVDSLLEQTFVNWELVVVDDGSTDSTRRLVSEYHDRRIKVVHQESRGEAGARNTALAHTCGEFLAFLDADDLFLPHHLELVVTRLRSQPEHVGVYTDGYHITDDGRRLTKLSARRRRPMTGRVFDEVVRGSDFFGPPVCVALRREAISRHHLRFDEGIVIGPDWDFFVRVSDVGSFGYVEDATCLYRVHDANITSRIGSDRRALELAKCRTNAIGMGSFGTCRLDVRVNVFHDLLVNLLREHPERQRAVIEGAPFSALPRIEQARLLRLMASKAILFGGQCAPISEWFERSRTLNPRDVRGAVVAALYRACPALCRAVLRLRTRNEPDPVKTTPFADLDGGRA